MRFLPTSIPSRARRGALVALVALAVGASAWPDVTAASRPQGPLVAVSSVDDAAVALAPAQRLAKVAPPNFPMEPSPRCDVLDNFGDPRSGGRSHEGTDILATLGQEVYAMVDGTLTAQTIDGASGSSLSGNMWKLTAGDGTGTTYVYAHLSGFAPGLAKGSLVHKGQLIGYVGDTGNPGAGNYHLHFEVHPNGGAAIDPLSVITVPAACRVY